MGSRPNEGDFQLAETYYVALQARLVLPSVNMAVAMFRETGAKPRAFSIEIFKTEGCSAREVNAFSIYPKSKGIVLMVKGLGINAILNDRLGSTGRLSMGEEEH